MFEATNLCVSRVDSNIVGSVYFSAMYEMRHVQNLNMQRLEARSPCCCSISTDYCFTLLKTFWYINMNILSFILHNGVHFVSVILLVPVLHNILCTGTNLLSGCLKDSILFFC